MQKKSYNPKIKTGKAIYILTAFSGKAVDF